MKNQRRRYYIYRMLTLFGALALAILLFFILFFMDNIKAGIGRLLGILMPFIYGAVIAYILKPVCNVLDRFYLRLLTRGGKKPRKRAPGIAAMLSILTGIVLGVIIVVTLLMMVIPQVVNSLSSIVAMVPSSIEHFTDWITKYLGDQPVLKNYIDSISEGVIDKLGAWLQQSLLPNLQMLVDGVTSGVVSIVNVVMNLFIGIIVAIYLLGSRKQFAAQSQMVIHSLIRERWANAIIGELKYADRMFCGFINGKVLDSAIIGVICFLFMWIFKMPYAMLVSVIVGVTNIIPFFGPYLGAVPSALLILMVSPPKCIGFLVFVIILQQFDGNILGPRILGNVTGLSSFWVLFAILTFGGLFGFIGMIVGVPVFAVIYDVVKKLIHKGLKYRGKEGLIAEYKKAYPDAPDKQ